MDEDLPAIESIQRGEESGLLELMTRHKESIFRFSYRYTGNEADANELTEEIFLRVFWNAGRFKPRAKVRTWIFAIAANLCRDFLRRRKKSQHVVSLHSESRPGESGTVEDRIFDKSGNPAELTASTESMQAMEAAIEDLPHKLKFPFVFCVLEDHSHDECADILGTGRKTVETRIYRARLRLRAQLTASSRDY